MLYCKYNRCYAGHRCGGRWCCQCGCQPTDCQLHMEVVMFPRSCDPAEWAAAFCGPLKSEAEIAEWFTAAFRAAGLYKNDFWKSGYGRMKAKVGDTVHVHGTVQAAERSGAYVVEVTGGTVVICERDIAHIEPHKLAVGDRVSIASSHCSGVILMIDCGLAWVKQSDGRYITADLKDLRCAP